MARTTKTETIINPIRALGTAKTIPRAILIRMCWNTVTLGHIFYSRLRKKSMQIAQSSKEKRAMKKYKGLRWRLARRVALKKILSLWKLSGTPFSSSFFFCLVARDKFSSLGTVTIL